MSVRKEVAPPVRFVREAVGPHNFWRFAFGVGQLTWRPRQSFRAISRLAREAVGPQTFCRPTALAFRPSIRLGDESRI